LWEAESVTVELSDSIVRRAEEKAKELGIPLSECLEQALDAGLSQPAAPGDNLMAGFGELRHLHEETERINRIIEEEFEQIEPEDWT